jgi:hypothetical protein
MPPKKKLTIVKVPLSYKPAFKPINFKPYPQLYLDLLENKEKVRPELRERYYEPKFYEEAPDKGAYINNEDITAAGQELKKQAEEFDHDNKFLGDINFSAEGRKYDRPIPVHQQTPHEPHPFHDNNPEFDTRLPPGQSSTSSSISASSNDFLSSVAGTSTFDKPYNVAKQESGSPHNTSSFTAKPESKPRYVLKTPFKSFSSTKDLPTIKDDDSGGLDFKRSTETKPIPSLKETALSFREKDPRAADRPTERYTEQQGERQGERQGDRPTADRPSDSSSAWERERDEERLKFEQEKRELQLQREQFEEQKKKYSNDPLATILMGSLEPESVSINTNAKSSSSQQSRPMPQQQSQSAPSQPSQPNYSMPPPLNAVGGGMFGGGQGGARPYSNPAQEELDAQKKREIIFKLKQLKTVYKDAQIPEVNEYQDLAVIQAQYDMFYRQLQLDSRVENYKKFLLCGFAVIEFVVQKLLKFEEMTGFTVQQLTNMNQYEKLLLEIGEKRKFEPDKGMAPELKLVGIIFINAAMFIGMKMLFKGGGNAILESIGQTATGGSSMPSPKPATSSGVSGGGDSKRKMRPPDVNMDDFL